MKELERFQTVADAYNSSILEVVALGSVVQDHEEVGARNPNSWFHHYPQSRAREMSACPVARLCVLSSISPFLRSAGLLARKRRCPQ